MQSAIGTLTGKKKFRLAYGQWYPEGEPRAVVLILHGMHEHMGRYRHVIDALVAQGFAVFALDHRGHGLSQGTPGHIEKFSYYIDDVEVLYRTARESHPTLPFFLLGHSLGGLIAFHYLLRRQDQFRGAILTGAGFIVGDDVSPVLKRVSHILMKLAPRLPILPPSGDGFLSRDPEIDRRWKEDPLTYDGSVRVSMGNQLMVYGEQAQTRFAELRLPLLLMHGTADRMTNPLGSERLYAESPSRDKTLKLWDGMYHEIFNEIGKEEVIRTMVEWIDERI